MTSTSRRRALQVLGASAFAALAAQTARVQLLEGPELAQVARNERTLTWKNLARRGTILGRNGTVLASSTVSYDVGVNQRLVSQYEQREIQEDPVTGKRTSVVVGYGAAAAAALVAPLLDEDPQELGAQMVGDSTYHVIAEAVTPDTWRRIKALGIPGIEPDQRTRRSYPSGSVAGNVLGFTYEGENRVLVGSAGLELTQDKVLRGTDGSGQVERGRTGAIIPTGEQHETPAVAGVTVRTTIDPDLQILAQQAIDETVDSEGADWGCVVVMEPSTGKVLVLADSHSVNPSDPGASAEADRAARSVQAIFEPGSVGKVITFAAALDEGQLRPEDTFDVPDSWTAPNGQSFRDSHPHGFQQMTASQVLAQSSNVGTVQIGDRMSDDVRYGYIKAFGYGSTTGIELPGESPGLLTEPSTWDNRTRYATMFGQGLAGTALQSAQVLATVANKGKHVPPRVIDAWIDENKKETKQVSGEPTQVISEASAQILTEMLIGVTQKGGTAETAAINGYLVAGKTGTTEILTQDGTIASFVGFTPARDPAITVAVIVYRPHGTYGGAVAGPVFRTVATAALRSLGIAPDPTIIASQDTGEQA